MDADPLTAQQIRVRFLERLVDRDGSLRKPNQAGPFRLLEKTPKNSLRIPFFHSIYPDARFVFLHRDPRENLSSIMEAWRAGGWTTYKALPEWDGPWSLLLPPGYAALRGKPLAEVAAFQWAAANRHVLDDLAELPRDRWIAVGYADFIADPATEVRRICAFIDVPVDAYLERIALTGKLPLSRYTLTPPAPDKWRRNAEAIATVIGAVDLLYERLLRTVLPAGVAQQKLDAFRRVPAQINRNEACYCGSTRRYKHCHGALV